MDSQPPPSREVRLSARAAGELIERSAAAVESGLPLDEVLIALAEETDNRRLRRAMLALADDVARGADVTTALGAVRRGLPRYVQHAIEASTSHTQTAALLAGLARHETTRRRLRRQMRSALLYPCIVIVLLGVIVCGAMLLIVPTFEEIYLDFDLALPQITTAFIAASKVVPWIFLGMLLFPVACGLIALAPPGARLVHWMRTSVPILGRIWTWNAHHEFASTLGALASEGVLLVDGLRYTADALEDRNLARSTRLAIARCESGAPLSTSLAESIHFDRSLTALVGWGESQDALPQALREAAALYEEEMEIHASLLRRVLPPVLFVTVLTTMGILIVGLLIPLVDLINNLSG